MIVENVKRIMTEALPSRELRIGFTPAQFRMGRVTYSE
ncbi:MAG: hypothetical protein BSOLF_0674 [Candidatus Carbobacillus altaicus]|uniref:Uncharacterized protein n=1 Tax=Candidatus Carbonibacillus altaicus TaxID=2163959 RepID=A0A2R6Y571_9BACL|nr:MAG: hypothetical protein BSOLF_0674 [Candidatus Carbobacillus altaicus]